MSEQDKKSLMIFGRDVSQIPCFRNSFLYGISGGLGAGLLYFLFTSRPKRSADVAFGSFVLITTAYWIQCRYEYSKKKFEMLKLQELLRRHTMYEGTGLEKEIDSKQEPVEV